jgi:tryptophan synthase alpha chain
LSRLAKCFESLKAAHKTGFVAYLSVGYPDVASTLELVPALVEGGADIIELGVPFSDPLADGTTIQRANYHALKHGVTPAICLEAARQLRERGVAVPFLFMGYYNPILAFGQEAFAREAADAGVDGLIVVDLPPEEGGPLRQSSFKYGLDLIPLLAPTSTEERISKATAQATGFIYCVSVTGITGARDELPADVENLVERVRKHTALPIAVGFGISKREHVAAVGRFADGAVVGSAIIDVIDKAEPTERAQAVKEYVKTITGRR